MRDERGSYTVESSIIFPVIFIIGVVVVFVGLYISQKVNIHYEAARVSLKSAHHWSNSYADPETGYFKPGEFDELYWRVFNDSITQLLGLSGGTKKATIDLQMSVDSDPDSLTQKKLFAHTQNVPDYLYGDFHFQHRGYERVIHSDFISSFDRPTVPFFSLHRYVSANASARVSEPVEFMRVYKMAGSYITQLRERNVKEADTKEGFEQFLGKKSPDGFQYHDPKQAFGSGAEAYLRELVDGHKPSPMQTSYGLRHIDALDRYGVVHQAYVTFTERQLRDVQMVKDAELLEKGKVVGVVWHFFRRPTQEGRVGPSDSLRRELERNGIVVVIHD